MQVEQTFPETEKSQEPEMPNPQNAEDKIED